MFSNIDVKGVGLAEMVTGVTAYTKEFRQIGVELKALHLYLWRRSLILGKHIVSTINNGANPFVAKTEPDTPMVDLFDYADHVGSNYKGGIINGV